MKVLHLNEHLALRGGVETYVLGLVPALDKHGCIPSVAYSEGNASLIENSHCVASLARGDRASEMEGYEALGAILEHERPDLVHVHQVYNIGALEACLERVPVVVHGHDYRYLCPASNFYYRGTQEICHRTSGLGCFVTTLGKHCLTPRPRYALPYYRRVRWFERQAARFAAVIAPSEAARARFLAVGFRPENVRTLPYFCPLAPAREPRRPPSNPVVLFIGRIRASKGIETFVEAIALLPKAIRGLMVGDFSPASRQEVESRARDLGCADRLELRGWVARDEVRQVMEEATVLAFPSLWDETLGIVGLEALACGVPVVASDVGGVREWLIPGETGLLVPPKEPAALAESLEKLVSNEALNRKLGWNGIELVRRKFSIDRHVERLLALYESAVKSREHGGRGACGAT